MNHECFFARLTNAESELSSCDLQLCFIRCDVISLFDDKITNKNMWEIKEKQNDDNDRTHKHGDLPIAISWSFCAWNFDFQLFSDTQCNKNFVSFLFYVRYSVVDKFFNLFHSHLLFFFASILQIFGFLFLLWLHSVNTLRFCIEFRQCDKNWPQLKERKKSFEFCTANVNAFAMKR